MLNKDWQWLRMAHHSLSTMSVHHDSHTPPISAISLSISPARIIVQSTPLLNIQNHHLNDAKQFGVSGLGSEPVAWTDHQHGACTSHEGPIGIPRPTRWHPIGSVAYTIWRPFALLERRQLKQLLPRFRNRRHDRHDPEIFITMSWKLNSSGQSMQSEHARVRCTGMNMVRLKGGWSPQGIRRATGDCWKPCIISSYQRWK